MTDETFKVGDFVWFLDKNETHTETRGQIGKIKSLVFGKSAWVEYEGLGVIELPTEELRHIQTSLTTIPMTGFSRLKKEIGELQINVPAVRRVLEKLPVSVDADVDEAHVKLKVEF